MSLIVQILNPKSKRYVKIDRATGRILAHKQSRGPYQGIPIVEVRARSPRKEPDAHATGRRQGPDRG